MVGEPIGQVGAHVTGLNPGTIGGCHVGGVAKDGKTAKDTRTPGQRASMLWLTQQMAGKFPGIRKISGQPVRRQCTSFDARRDALGRLAA